jgi:hypothetical protein
VILGQRGKLAQDTGNVAYRGSGSERLPATCAGARPGRGEPDDCDPTDPDDVRAFIDVFTDIRGLAAPHHPAARAAVPSARS